MRKSRKQLIQEFADKHFGLDYVFVEDVTPPRKYQTCFVCWNDSHKEFYGFLVHGQEDKQIKVAVTLEEFEKWKEQKRDRQRVLANAKYDPRLSYIGRECGKSVKIALRKKKRDAQEKGCVVIEDDL